MVQDGQSWNWRLGLAGFLVIGSAIVFWNHCALAQITPDGTLGAEGSTVTPNVNIGGLPGDRIDGGATRGTNLFHSFLDFNVGNGQRVYFSNPVGIENILSRVTGNNLSNILGTLGVDGGANLFLLNPNGIIFGENAKLDIAGSFVASTANSVVFNNGYQFSAKNPEAPPLLTVNVPLGVQYGTNQLSTTIANSGNLAVGKNFTLLAGNLDLQGQLQAGRDLTLQAQDTVKVRDSSTSPFIASSDGNLLVQGNQGVDIFALNHPDSGLFSGGNMVLRSANTVAGDTHYWSGCSFRIEKLDGSLGDLYSPYDPIIASNGDVALGSYTGTSLHIFAGGSVTIPGTVEITGSDPITGWTEIVTLSNGDTVSVNGETEPTLDVRAGIDWITLPGNLTIGTIAPPLPVFGTTSTSADISIGNIITDIVGGNGGIVLLTNQYQPNPSLNGQIRVGGIDTRDFSGGGSVFIDSRNEITLTGEIDNSLNLDDTGSGSAGDVTLLAVGDISLRDGGGINSESRNDITSNSYSVITLTSTEGSVFLNQAKLTTANDSTGYAGDIRIDTRDQVAITNQTDISSNGRAGRIFIGNTISPTTVMIDNGSQLSTTNNGTGYAGDIQIDAREQVVITNASSLQANGWAGRVTVNANNQVAITNSFITSTSNTDKTSPFSEVNITATEGSVFLKQAGISTSNSGTGYAGDISINARDQVAMINQSVISSTGRAGCVFVGNTISPTTVIIDNRTQLSTENSGTRYAGDIFINASERVEIANQSSINSDGWFGRIFIGNAIAPKLVEISNSTLRTSTSGELRGGDIRIDTGSLSVVNGAQLIASTSGEGHAGSVIIHATDSVSFDGDGSSAQSTVGKEASGNGGSISITTRSLFVTNGAQLNASTFGRGNAGNVNITATDSVTFDGVSISGLSSAAGGDVFAGAEGNAGDLNIITGSLSVTNGAGLSTSTYGRGNAGSVNITATDSVIFDGVGSNGRYSGAFSKVFSTAEASGGDINIHARSLSLTNGAQLNADTNGKGDAGHISVRVDNLLSLADESFISSKVLSQAVGNAGDLSIVAGKLTLDGESYISSDIYGQGNAGKISTQVDGLISLAGSSYISTEVVSGAFGKGGNITITADSLASEDGAYVATTTAGQAGVSGRANAGSIEVNLTNSLSASGGSHLRSNTFGEGDGGNITIQAGGTVSFEGVGANGISSGAFTFVGNDVQQGLLGRGTGGNIHINARSLFLTNGAQLDADTYGQGNAGNISVQVNNSIALTNISSISSDTHGQGNAGSVVTQANDFITLTGGSWISSLVSSGAVGQGGNITLRTGSLFVTNGAELNTPTFGRGNAGNIIIRASDTVSFDGVSSQVVSGVERDWNQGVVGIGQGGNIDIQARFFSLTGGAELRTQTYGQGKAGDIYINASEAVTLSGVAPFPMLGDGRPGGFSTGLLTSTEQGAIGRGGNISVTTPNLRLSDGAVLSTRSQSAFTGGSITINVNALEITGGTQMLTTAFSDGDAGNITVNATERVTISGSDPTYFDRFNQLAAVFGEPQARFTIDPVSPESGLFANTVPGSTGKGGSIFINSNQVTISNSAKVAVDSQGQGNGGNINILTNSLTLNDQASIVAQTASGEGGNITLQVPDILLMRHNSLISAEAGGTGNGGNIDIDAGFIVAVPKEDSDIVANAFEGRGGNINITTQGIYGLKYRPQRTPLSDITASSPFGVDGIVEINTPFVDPSQGLAQLPTNVVDPTKLIDRHCTPTQSSDRRSSFTITGRGGLPPSPNEPLRNEEVITNWITLPSEEESPDAAPPDKSTHSTNQPLVEAQGWMINEQGQVVLTAEGTTVTPQNPWLPSPSCPASQSSTQ